MTDNPTLLATERANKAGHSGAWTPADALREVLQQIEAGELELERVWILGMRADGDMTQWRAGTTHESTVAAYEVAKLDAIREWQSGDG